MERLKRIIVLMLAAVLVLNLSFSYTEGAYSQGTTVTFSDLNLEKAIRDQLQKPTGSITTVDMASITTLDASSRGITDISGLQHLTNVTTLILSDNNIKSLTPLQGLRKIEILEAHLNIIADVTPLKDITSLKYLSLGVNEITSIAALSSLTNLEMLDMTRNNIKDLTPLSSLIKLNALILRDNQITSISSIKNLTSLNYLDLSQNLISSISDLSGLVNLEGLELSSNNISDITSLSNLTKLQSLGLGNNKIQTLTPISNIKSLMFLDLQNCGITNIINLQGLTNLISLDLSHNNVSDLSYVRSLSKLEYLLIPNNNIKDNQLNHISTLSSLSMLNLNQNPITTLKDLAIGTKLNNLSDLYIWGINGAGSDVRFSTLEKKINNVLGQIIKTGMDDLDKVIAVHDYLTQNSRQSLIGGGSGEYSVLIEASANHNDYAETFNYFMKVLNIESHSVFGSARNWNLVKLGQNYFHIDLGMHAWGNGATEYTYFLLSTNELKKLRQNVDLAMTAPHLQGKSATSDSYLSLRNILNGYWYKREQMVVRAGVIYYANRQDNNHIYKSNINGTSPLLIIADRAQNIELEGHIIYYTNLADNKLYRISTLGSNLQLVQDLRVVETLPRLNSSNITISKQNKIEITFNKPIKANDLNQIKFVNSQGTNVARTVSVSGSKLIIQPNADLQMGMEYNIQVPKTSISAQDGKVMASDYNYAFTTQTAIAALKVVLSNPSSGANNVLSSLNQIRISFNSPVVIKEDKPGVTLKDNTGKIIPVSVKTEDASLIIDISTPLENSRTYTVTIDAAKEVSYGLKDIYGNSLEQNYSMSFITSSLKPITKLELTGGPILVPIGKVRKANLIKTPVDSDQPVVWSMINSAVAQVDQSGNITGLQPGSTKVKVATNAGNISAQLDVYAFRYGDVNGDNKVDVLDAILKLRHISGKLATPFSPGNAAAGDVNGDGKIDVLDAILNLRKISGKLDKFPADK